jgi:DNA-binding LacI/PurR family transcriptional regulator
MPRSKSAHRPVNLDDVARGAGVSAQTVSRVINDQPGVAEETKARVLEAIRTLGYRPNQAARNLVTRRSKIIGMIVTDFAQGFFPQTTQSVEREAAAYGYAVNIATVSDDMRRARSAFTQLRDRRFDGVIINTGVSGFEADLQRAAAEHFPIVLVHEDLDGIPATVKWPGFRSGARMAVEHLLSIGRRRIAFLATSNDSLIDRDKLAGYREALSEAGVEFDPRLIMESQRDFRDGFNTMGDLLQAQPDIDAVFSASDVRAVGALRYLAINGIDVPGQIAIVAFGNSTLASMVTPSLSTVSMPRTLIGKYAVQALIEMIDGKPAAPRYVHDQPVLVVGESSLLQSRANVRLTQSELAHGDASDITLPQIGKEEGGPMS